MIFRGIGADSHEIERITFCIDQLEKAKEFNKDFTIHTEIVKDLCIEEIISALLSAETMLKQRPDE